ncbi:putative ribonuclease H-like domain-containing protein [Tanacetum coccineum]|uniref:Ribonuclease H-like domain-containing protein n=1 Tax=Tanacetum coccineum TaxID=301880 RepID=A0ABQ5D1W5_9ASTR
MLHHVASKTSHCLPYARRNNEKALNILLSAIPDRHLLSFHDATNAKPLFSWTANKARFGGNEASKKMQKNLLKQQFETFTIGSREELDSAYERFQNILIVQMIRGQPGLDELEFDDLYNNLKVYEHELKGVSNSSSQNIAFLSTEVKGSTLKQSTADPANIPKGYTQATSSKTCTNDEGCMEEIDIRWQVAMITARIRKFMRKTGRPIDLKPKNGITFDKSKIECFNCQKLGHFARECRFAKYQENRANGRMKKRIVAIEDSNSKALVATDNNEDIDWTKEFDAEPVTFAMMALTEVEQDDWSMEFDAEHVHFGKIWTGDFDWAGPQSLLIHQWKYGLTRISDLKQEDKQKELGSALKKERDDFRVESSSSMESDNSLGIQIRLNLCTARPRVPQAVLSQSTGRPYHPRMDNIRPRTSSFSPSSRSSTTRTPHRPQRPKKIMKSIWGNPEEDLKDYAIIDSGCLMKRNSIKTSCIDFEKVSYVEELTLDSKNIIPSGEITCLVAKATKDEAVLWHRRLGHVNFIINKLVKGNLVRGLPSKTFKLDHSCLACRKGKQHRASCKKIEERTVREPLELLHMDLFGPVSVESVNRKKYCLVVTDDCSKFSWVFFLAYKDETYDMLHDLIVGLENKLRHKVKTIRCDHGTEFKNQLMNEFCAKKGIKREYSIARTPQQNGVAERKNRTLIEATRTMLADSLLPIQFWVKQFNTVVIFMRPFGCPLTILNTLDHLGKFDGKSEEGYLLGYSTNSKGFRVYNRVTRKVQDCLHVNFLENQENQKGKGPDWMFDLELLTPSMNYIPFIVHGPSINPVQNKQHTADKEVPLSSDEQALHDELVSLMHQESLAKIHNDAQRNAFEEEKRRIALEKGKECVDSTFTLSTANTPSQSTGNTPTDSDDDVPKDGVFSTNSFDDENTDTEEGGAADYNNMDPTIDVTSTPTLRIHKIHPQSQIIGKSTAGILTRRKLKESASDQHQLAGTKKVSQALADESWVEAMQEELLQFKLQEKKCMSTASRFDRSFASKTRRGAIDKTLFIKKDRRDIMLVQVYVDDIIFGSTKSSMVKDFEELMQKEFKMSSMGELTFFLGLQVKQTSAGIFLSQDKYVKDILNKFDFRTIKPASTPIEAHKSLGKDEEGEEVDVHLYRSMIGCLMYLTASRPDIMFAVCLCARFQVTPKVSHIHAVKRIFRYLKHQPKLGLWYPKDSPFHLEAFSDSDYAGDNHDRRSTSGGCQYLGRRLVSWQCKKQTIVAISSTEAEYVAAASCCAQNLFFTHRTKLFRFAITLFEIVMSGLINVVKVHTDDNVADLLTKGFDLARFNFLVVTIGSLEALSLHLRGGYE